LTNNNNNNIIIIIIIIIIIPVHTRIVTGHTFVGFVDDERALIQHETQLYMMELGPIR
jgi:hypothetical protein